MMDNRVKNSRGVALVTAIVFSISMVILVGSILTLARGHYHSTAQQIKHAKAFYLAQAGVEWAVHKCRDAPALFPADDINKLGGELALNLNRIEDPPGSGYYPPIVVRIRNPQPGDPPGITYHIDSAVDANNVRIK
ncbi:MAG: hypothetical protein U9Q08_00555 [Candidatus Omnitrophota bacterium]|nr:hypothetical protein [Candidatus Omnitrophota bacterium]